MKIEELVVVFLIILLLFGAKKIPELSRSIGQSAREIKKGFNGEETEPTGKSSDKKKSSK